MNKHISQRAISWDVLPTALLHGKIEDLKSNGHQITDLTIGVSNLPMPESGKKAAIEAIEQNNFPYTAIGGSESLKKTIVKKINETAIVPVTKANCIATTGAKQAIFEALYVLTNPGDTIAVFKPYWPVYQQMANMHQLQVQIIEEKYSTDMHNSGITNEVKVILFENPHNPTGRVYTKKELEHLLTFAEQKGIFLIADESYENLVYEEHYTPVRSIAPNPHKFLITVSSVSQSFSMMGWRLGYAVADAQIITAMEAIQSATTAATSAVTQAAAIAIIADEKEYIQNLQNEFRTRRDIFYNKIAAIDWIACNKPQSGPYLWCDIRKLTSDSMQFAMNLLEKEKIAVMPGDTFGSPGFIRIAYNTQPTEVLEKAAITIKEFGESYGK